MFLSRIIILILSVPLISSCTIPVFKDQNGGDKISYNDSQKSNSGIDTKNTTPSGSIDVPAKPMIDTNTITLNKNIIKTPPVVIDTNTINESEKDDCVKKFELISDQQNCIDNFYTKKAMLSKKGDVCDSITSTILKDTCRDNVLLQEITTKNDATLCKELKNPEAAGNCYAIVGRQKQSQDQKIVGQVTDSCTEIADKDIKSACVESAIFNEAVRVRDTTMCKTLVNQMRQGMCASLIKSILENSNPLK